MKRILAAAALVLMIGAGMGVGAYAQNHKADPDGILANEADGTNWPLYGRTFSADHYSPLTQINDKNVSRLGLAWSLDLPDPGSLFSEPLEVSGVLYFTVGLSVIHAVDARTGKELWVYDPETGKATGPSGAKLRAAWGSRGIAWWDGKVYTGTQDGRLIAIDAKTGKPVWSVQTTEGPNDGRYITGAPWVFRGKVVIGHGGADFTPLRGYVTAYDARTGKKLWRFYTVPGDPAKGPDGEASDSVMPMAAKTWKGEQWKQGGGGTVWNAMAYDPKFNRLYIGTGNGFPQNAKIRSPGGGDNLFLCSIVALDADTGRYVWHYQVNPGETWDYNAAMDIELTDMKIGGKVRPVLLHAPKSGFFYVIDRQTGKLLSAKPIVKVNWAKGIDMKTGRPIENPEARMPDSQDRGSEVWPNAIGAHGPQPMSYNPKTGLTYITTVNAGHYWTDKGVDREKWKPGQLGLFGGMADGGWSYLPGPKPLPEPQFSLLAWNPKTQSKAWSAPMPSLWGSGGTMSTGGNLVFNGDSDGWLKAYDAVTGKVLWSYDARTGVSSDPITYMLDGKQYVTLLAGFRGTVFAPSPWDYRTQPRRVLTFVLDGKATLPPRQAHIKHFLDDPAFQVDQAKAQLGEILYGVRRCAMCHGGAVQGTSLAPDLRESPIPMSREAMFAVVHDGALQARGMPAFPELSADDVEAIRHYIRLHARLGIEGKSPHLPNILAQ